MRIAQILAVALVALLGTTTVAAAQTAATPSSALQWDHDGIDTSRYELQVDGSAWVEVATSTPAPGVRSTPMPALTPGTHTLAVRACGLAGCSAPSGTLTVQMVVVPSVPTGLRIGPPVDAGIVRPNPPGLRGEL
jgi:hypothetical protein